MLGRLPSLTIVRLLAALLLVTIGLQAGASFEATPLPTHGSAFSAETYEVALAPQRRAVVAALTAATPLLPQAPILFAAAPLRLAALSAQPAPRPDSTGPPARPVLTRPAAPRAPPPA